MNSNLDKVIVIVTRSKGEAVEMLAASDLDSIESHLISNSIQAGEHPCEAALRILKEQIGNDQFVSFHKLKTSPPLHAFHTSCEQELPDQWTHKGQNLKWLDLQSQQSEGCFGDNSGLRELILGNH